MEKTITQPELVSLRESKTCRIFTRLYEKKGYVSGQELCEDLGISRTAVWKAINQLREQGYDISSASRLGYRLEGGPDRMSCEALAPFLHTEWAGQTYCYKEETESTNQDIRLLAEQGAPHGTLAAADYQSGGKGRRGRTWSAQPGTSIAMSILLRPDFAPAQASMVTLVMGMAVARACRGEYGIPAQIKWPNDVVCRGRKLCGILTELNTEVDYINYLVSGVGINCSQEAFPEELAATATSLCLESGKKGNRAALIGACMNHFESYYRQFCRDGDMTGLMKEYNEWLVGIGDQVRILSPHSEKTGISRGINANGELLVCLADGTVEPVYAGEVSVRGVYGYAR